MKVVLAVQASEKSACTVMEICEVGARRELKVKYVSGMVVVVASLTYFLM